MEVALGPICARCSKRLLPETFTWVAGRPIHFRCLARVTRLDSIEQEDRASRERGRARNLTQRARDLVEQSRRARQSTCPVCGRPLADGGSLLYEGEKLVHAFCWRAADAGKEDSETAAPTPSGDARPFAGVRILVIDDHVDSRDALQQVLEVLGATVHAAGDGGDGLAIAERERPHLVLCDLRLPGMDGFAVLAALRASLPDHPIRVLAVTGLGRADDVKRCRAAGFDGHLVKPLDYDRLVATVGRVLALGAV
jgi:CheY-like chemotaxis protein